MISEGSGFMFICSFKLSALKIIAAFMVCIAGAVAVISLLPDAGYAMNVNKTLVGNEISLSDKIVLPIALEKATYREFSLSKKSIREEVAYEVMGETLARKFSEKKDCEVLETKLITSADENLAYATLQAECVEKIGKERKILRDG